MKNKKILFLDTDADSSFRYERNKISGVDSMYLYKDRNLFINFMIFLGIKINEKFLWFSYGKWKKNIDNYDIIILPSRKSSKYALSYLNKKYKKRIIVWYWNIVTKYELLPDFCKSKGAEVWTFDYGDSKKYNMQFNNQYYFNFSSFSRNHGIRNDIYYIGAEKEDRTNIILNFINSIKQYGLLNSINIVKNNKLPANPNISYVKEKKYNTIVNEILESKAILDINNKGQIGLTLRPLEAMFYKKKLITNNTNIKCFDFYNKNNIFIIGEDKIEDIVSFINSKYVDLPKKIVSYYSFENWIKRIVEGVEK